jgi:hypothetical protein
MSFYLIKGSSLVIWLIMIYLEALQRHPQESAGNEFLITFRTLAPEEQNSVSLFVSLFVELISFYENAILP